MNIGNIGKLVQKDYEAGEFMKEVTAIKNQVKDKEKVYDEVLSDHFKTLRDPIIEQQKASQKSLDEKQDKIIEQLQKNQSALEDIVMLQELPEPAEKTEEASKLPIDYKPSMMKSNMDEGSIHDEGKTLLKHGLFPPSDVLIRVKDKHLIGKIIMLI